MICWEAVTEKERSSDYPMTRLTMSIDECRSEQMVIPFLNMHTSYITFSVETKYHEPGYETETASIALTLIIQG